MNIILIIVGIIAIIYTILRIILLICIEVYNRIHDHCYGIITDEYVGKTSDFNLLPAIEITWLNNYICVYYKWLWFYYYIDFKIQEEE